MCCFWLKQIRGSVMQWDVVAALRAPFRKALIREIDVIPACRNGRG
jgi:hypothetical protein